jgi:hypothetical protein
VFDATRMFDNVQTLRVGIDMLFIGLALHWVWHVIAKRAMNIDRVITRRALVKGGLIAGALVPVAGLFMSGAAYADLPALDPSDPAARGRDYVIKSAKSVAYCGNCSLYKKTGDSMGSCALFAGNSVAFAGWCSGWVKIGAP